MDVVTWQPLPAPRLLTRTSCHSTGPIDHNQVPM